MDIKDLNKSQYILLTLLVSFVVSIATGITTVTLMQQAPPAVTQTINRVIQKTIETVSPSSDKSSQKTIIIKQEDLVVDAIDKNVKSIAVIKKVISDKESETAGFGFFITPDGYLLTDSRNIAKDAEYFINYEDNDFKAKVISDNISGKGLSLLKGELPEGPNIKVKAFGFSELADSKNTKVGQDIVVIKGNPLAVEEGIISSFDKILGETAETNFDIIKTNLALGRSYSGGMVINSDGGLIGVLIVGENTSYILPGELVKTLVEAGKKV